MISKIEPGSIAEELEIEPGDALLSVNGKKVKDILDFLFQTADDSLEIEIKKPNGEIWDLEIEKDYYEEIGIEFGNPILDDAKRCHNQCVFCFVDQLPPGMRETLYFKDDDSRLSFLQGNYVTLTNVKDEDLDRMIEYKLSPVNVSIHTTNPELRQTMLCNRYAGDILMRLRKLTEHNIEVNGQIVLVPGINDGAELDRTLRDLSTLGENLISVAAVPVGVTRFRQSLPSITLYDKKTAVGVVSQVEIWQKHFQLTLGRRLIHLSDEFYVVSDLPIPDFESYEGFRQIENGVGLIRKFDTEVDQALLEIPDNRTFDLFKRIDIVTGTLAVSFMQSIAERIMKRLPGLDLRVHAIENRFFGETITVAGLVTGIDIYETLKKNHDIRCVLLPEAMLKAEETCLLDDWTIDALSEKLDIPVYSVRVEGCALIKCILDIIDDKSPSEPEEH